MKRQRSARNDGWRAVSDRPVKHEPGIRVSTTITPSFVNTQCSSRSRYFPYPPAAGTALGRRIRLRREPPVQPHIRLLPAHAGTVSTCCGCCCGTIAACCRRMRGTVSTRCGCCCGTIAASCGLALRRLCHHIITLLTIDRQEPQHEHQNSYYNHRRFIHFVISSSVR